MALENTKANTHLSYANNKDGYSFVYTGYQDEGKNVTDIQVIAKRGETRVLNGTLFSNGRKSIIIENGVSDADAKTLIDTAIADANSIFAERNKTE